MATEFLYTEKHYDTPAGESKSWILMRDQLYNRRITIAISGHAKTSLSDVVNLYIKAGTGYVDLANLAEIIFADGSNGCLVRIDFPITGLEIKVTAPGSPIGISVYGGNTL